MTRLNLHKESYDEAADRNPKPEPMPQTLSGAKRVGLHRIPFDLVPFEEIAEAYARVSEFGAKRYGVWNWTLGLPRVQLIRSLLNHVFKYLRGEDIDKESGLSHTDHILWNAVALTHALHHNINDNRRVEPHRDYHKRNDCFAEEIKTTHKK
jgi:Domain of unknown function (DUF5664)